MIKKISFIHGFGGNSSHWRWVADRLSPGFDLTFFDLPGHGSSDVIDGPHTIRAAAEAFLEELEAPSIVVGHSMGVRIALQAADIAPDQVRGLVLVDGSAQSIPAAAIIESFYRLMMEKGYESFCEDLLAGFLTHGLPRSLRRELLDSLLDIGVFTASDYWISMAHFDNAALESCLANTACPILAIQSTAVLESVGRGRVYAHEAPETRWSTLLAAEPNVDVEVLKNIGHYSMIEVPDVVADLIGSFVTELQSTRIGPDVIPTDGRDISASAHG
ncbi:MAG: alpha/beta hydrolase [Pseudomonadota bacterium]